MRKKILSIIIALAFIVLAAINVGLNSQNNESSAISMANAEALATPESEWYSGMTTSSITIEGITIPCCVQSSASNACNYGTTGCLHYCPLFLILNFKL